MKRTGERGKSNWKEWSKEGKRGGKKVNKRERRGRKKGKEKKKYKKERERTKEWKRKRKEVTRLESLFKSITTGLRVWVQELGEFPSNADVLLTQEWEPSQGGLPVCLKHSCFSMFL